MKKSEQYKRKAEEIMSRIERLKNQKQRIIDFVNSWQDRLDSKEINKLEFNTLISEKLKHRSLAETVEEYNSYLRKYYTLLSRYEQKIDDCYRRRYVSLSLILALFIAAGIFIRPILTGRVVAPEQNLIAETVDLYFNESTSYTHLLKHNPTSLMVSGEIIGQGRLRIYLDDKVVLDSDKLDTEQGLMTITGRATEIVEENGTLIETTTSTSTTNTPASETTTLSSSTTTTANETTSTVLENITTSTSTIFVTTTTLRNIAPTSTSTTTLQNLTTAALANETSTTTTEPNITTTSSTTTTIFNVTTTSTTTSTESNVTTTTQLNVITTSTTTTTLPKFIEFDNYCLETCFLANVSKEITLTIEIENVTLHIAELTYSFVDEEDSNITIYNISNILKENHTQVEINKPALWNKIVNTSIDNKIKLTSEAYDLSSSSAAKIKIKDKELTVDEYNLEKAYSKLVRELHKLEKPTKKEELDITLEKISELNTQISLIENKVQKLEFEEDITLTFESASEIVNISYITDGPSVEEKEVSEYKKIITVSSPLHYENVLAYTNITESRRESINVYWLKDSGKELFNDRVLFIDTNENGLIDKIEWTIPHLSNQSFEISIKILNVQSYPMVGGNWTVLFNTTGEANLTIIPYDDTTYTEVWTDNINTEDDLELLKISCDDTIYFDKLSDYYLDEVYFVLADNSLIDIDSVKGNSYPIKGVTILNYSCNLTGEHTVLVNTEGDHHLMFYFGEENASANNYAYSQNETAWEEQILTGSRYERTTTSDIGLVGYWSFEEGTGTTTYDKTQYGNDGTISGAEWIAGKRGNALNFNGSGDYVKAQSDTFKNQIFSTEAWVKTTDEEAEVVSYTNLSGYYGWTVRTITGGRVRLSLISSTGSSLGSVESTVSISDGSWHHIATTDSGSTLRMYIDGKISNISNSASKVWNSSMILYHGAYRPESALEKRYMNGTIDEVRIYNRSLSASEIWDHYQERYGIYLNKTLRQKPHACDDNVLAMFRMDENAFDSCSNETTALGEDDTAIPTFEPGKVGLAASFDGTDDCIGFLPDNTIFEAGFTVRTVDFWFKANELDGNQTLYEEGGSTNGMAIRLNDDVLQWATQDAQDMFVLNTTIVNTNRWYHVMAVFNCNNMTLYLDGEIKNFTTTNFTGCEISAHSNDGGIGYSKSQDAFDYTGSGNYFNGSIDEFRVSDKVRNIDEIYEFYRLGYYTNPETDATTKVSWTLRWNSSSKTNYEALDGDLNYTYLANDTVLVVFQPGPSEGIDTYTNSGSPTTSYATSDVLWFGAGTGKPIPYYRPLLFFDLGIIPKNSEIIDANLTLYIQDADGTAPGMDCYRATSSWEESVTWNTLPKYDSSAPIATFAGDQEEYTSETVSVTATIAKWVNGTYTNYGFYCKGTETENTRGNFTSSDYATEYMRPKLTILYKPTSKIYLQTRVSDDNLTWGVWTGNYPVPQINENISTLEADGTLLLLPFEEYDPDIESDYYMDYEGYYEETPEHPYLDDRDGLIGYWSLDGNGWDYSKYSNDASVINASSTPNGRIGGAYEFDGVDDFIKIDDSDDFEPDGENISIELWFKLNEKWNSSVTDYVHLIYHYYAIDPIYTGYQLFLNTNGNLTFLYGADGGSIISSRSSWEPDVWYHITAIIDDSANQERLYVNGVLDNNGTTVSNINYVTATDLYIGSTGSTNYFNGTIDEVAIYDSVLSDVEIKEHASLASIKEGKFQSAAYINSTSLVYPVGVPNNENTLLVCRFDEDTNPYVCAQGEYGNNKRNYTFIDSTNNKAYEWNTTGTTFTTTNAINDAYSTLTSDDGSYQSIQTEASTYYPYTRFDFKIDEKEDDINNITIKWIGFGDLAGAAVGTEGFTIYVYNFTGWEPKASSTSASEQTVTINLSSSELNEFINTTGHLLVVARGPSFGVCGGSTCYANISTDYIAIEVNTKNDTVSGKYDQGVRINSNHTQTLIYPTKNNFNKDAGTIEFWVKTDWYSNSTVGPHYLFEEESSYQKNEMYIYFTGLPMGDPLYFMMYDSAGPKYIRNNINNSWAPEEWHHIAVVWDSQNPVSGSNYLEMYIDGSTSGNTYDETTSSMSITDTADTMYLGSDASGANQANATFDEFAIYDYAKTREEIIQDYLGNINVSRGTIEFWVKTDNDCDQMTDPYFYDLEASDNQNEIEIYWSSGDEGLYFNIYNSTGGLKSVFNDPFMCVANRWHHIAAVWDINAAVSGSNYMELYIDGSNTGNTYSDTTSPISLTATAPLIYIGSDSSKANNCNCTIDDFKISNYAKTSSQIYPQGYELGSGESVLGTGRYAQWRAIFNTRDIDPTGVLSGVILEGTENAPTFSTYGITPDPAYTGSNLSCSALILDDYNASINVEYKWYNQTGGSGDFILGGNTTISNNSNTVVSTLGSGNTTPGEIWNCTLRAYDGTDYSEYVSDAITISSSALALNTTRLYPLENLSINITGANNNCTIYIKRPDNHTDSFNGTVIDEICYASSIPSYLNGTYYINGTADGSYTTTLSFNVSTNWTNIIINDFQSNVSLIQIWDSFNLSLNLNDTQSNTLTGFTSNSSDPNFNYDIQGPSESCGIDIKREIIRIDENGTATARLVVEFDSGGWGGVGWEEEFKAGTNVTITILGKDGISPMNSAIAITNGTINGGGYIAHELVNNSGIYTFYVNVTSEIFDTMRGAYIEFIIPLPNSLSDVVARIDYIRFYYDSGGEDNISIADKTIEAGETGDVIFSQNSEFAGLGRFPIYLTLNPNYHGTIWYPINSSLSIENLNGELSETNGYYSNIWTWDDYVNTNFSVRAYADRWGYQSDLSDSVAININNSNYDKDLFINDFQANTTYYYPGESINLSFYLNNSDSIAQADYLTNLSDWNPDYRDVIKNEATALEIRREIDSIAEDGTVTAKVIVEFDAAGQLGIGNEAEILAGTNVTISIFGKDGVSPVSSGISLSTAETDPDYVWTNLTNSSGTYTFKAAVLSTISSQTEQGYLILTIPPHLSLSDTIIRIDYIKYVYDYGSPDYIYINDQYVQDENLSGGDYGFVIYDTGDLFSTSIGRFPVYLPLNPNENGTVYFALDSNLGFNSVSSQIYSGSGHYSNIFIWDDYVLDNISSFAYADKWPYNKALSGKRNFTLNEKNLTLSVSNITANTSYYFPNSTIEFNTTLVDKNNLSLSNFNWSDYGMDIYSRNNQESALEIRREIVNISSDGSITARLIVELDSAEDTSAFNDNPYINSGTTVNLSVYGSDGFSPLPGDISIINRTNDTNARTSHTFANNTGIYSLSVSLDTNIEGEVIQVYLEFSIPPNRSLADIVFSVNSIYFKYDSGGTDYIIVGGTTVTDPQGGTGIAEYNTGDEFATSNKFPIYLPLSMPSYGTLFLKAFSGNNGEPINGNLSESYGNYTLLHTWETESIDDFNVSFCANKWQYNNGNLTCTDNAIVLIRAKPIIDNVSDGYDYPNKVEIGENVTFVINYTLDPEPDEPAKLIICNSTNINSSGCSDKEFCQSSYSTDRKQNCSYEVEWGVFEEENVSYWVKICTDSGACSNLSNEYNFTVNLTSETPRIFSNETIPSKVYYTGAHGTTFVIEANVSDNNLLSVNFTLTNPSNTNVIDNVNASSYHEDLFNSSSYTIDEYGQWNYTITAWDADANSESDYGNIKFLQITETLSPSTAITGQSVNIYGHINDSSWNDVINTSVYIHQDGSLMNVTGGWNCGSSWWDCDWTYKKQINISLGVESNLNNTITLVNFSTIDEISAGKIKTNCGDVRFFDSNGNELQYTLETSTCNSSNTIFWVWTNLTGNANTTVYAYYGNSDASAKTDYYNPDNSLVLYYHLDNSSLYGSSTKIFDYSLNNNGSYVNEAFINASGYYGGSLQVDGSNDYIKTDANLPINTTNNRTIMMWIKVFDDGTGGIFQLGNSGASTGVFSPYLGNYQICYWGHSADYCTGDYMGANVWNHFAVTYNGSNIKIYLNGTLMDNRSNSVNTRDDVAKFGMQDWQGYLKSNIDEIRIYNRTLSADEILAIYNSTQLFFIGNQTATQTDSTGYYNYTFTAPSTAGSYEIKVNSTYNGVYGEQNQTLTVQQAPVINSNTTIPSRVYYTGAYGTTFIINANVTDDNLLSVNFTLTNPSGSNVIENVNASAHSGDFWNSSSYTINEYGQWNYTVIAWDEDGLNDTNYGNIKFLQITETLSESIVRNSESVIVAGHVNDSDWNNVVNQSISIYLNGSPVNITGGWNLDGWWNSSWEYRKRIRISENNNSNLSNVQFVITVDTFSLISNTKLQPDCSDIRISDNESNKVDYWIENQSSCNSSSTGIWIKANLTANINNTFYLYYGNPSVSNESLKDSVFPLYDFYPDFTGWSNTTTTSCGDYNMLGGYNIFGLGAYAEKNISNLPADHYLVSFNYYHIDSWDNERGFFFWNRTEVWNRTHYTSGSNICGAGYADSAGLSYSTVVLNLTYVGGPISLRFNSSLDQASTDESFGINTVFVRKYVQNEPTHTSTDEEESLVRTDSTGYYNYTFTAPSAGGSYEIKVNLTYNGVYGEANQTLTVQQTPVINSNATIPSRVYYTGTYGTTFVINANVTDDNLISVNITLTNPSGTNVIDNVNGTAYSGDFWNSSSYTINEYGQWKYTVIAWDEDGLNDTNYGNIKFLQITETLSPSSTLGGETIGVYGHINDSDWNNVVNTNAELFINNVAYPSGWWNNTWDYRCNITVTETESETVTDALVKFNGTDVFSQCPSLNQSKENSLRAVYNNVLLSSEVEDTSDGDDVFDDDDTFIFLLNVTADESYNVQIYFDEFYNTSYQNNVTQFGDVIIYSPENCSGAHNWMTAGDKTTVREYLMSNLNAKSVSWVNYNQQNDTLVSWYEDNVNDGEVDTIIILDTGAFYLYAGENDGSRAENWTDCGNMIVWTGELAFYEYCNENCSCGTSGAGWDGGIDILDTAASPLQGSGTSEKNANGTKYIPSLLSSWTPARMVETDELGAYWSYGTVMFANTSNTDSDAIVIENQNGGYYAQFYVDDDSACDATRDNVFEEFIENWLIRNSYTSITPQTEEHLIITNSSGDYSYTFTAPSTAGSYEIKVNSTYNGVYGEQNQTLTVQQAPVINSNTTIPSRVYYTGTYGTIFVINANVTDDNLISVNYTLTNPSGTDVIDNENASSYSGDLWNSTSYTIDEYGQWNYTIIAWDEDGLNDTNYGNIKFLQITETLTPSSTLGGETISVYGHINDSDWNDVIDTSVYIYRDGSLMNVTGGWNCGSSWWNCSWGYRKQINISLGVASNLNNTITLVNFSTIDEISAGKIKTNCGDVRFFDSNGNELQYTLETPTCNSSNTIFWVWTNLTGNANTTVYAYYGNSDASAKTDYYNPDNSLVLYMHFDNSSSYGENDSQVFDFSKNGNNGSMGGGNEFINSSGRFGGAVQLDGNDDYVKVDDSDSISITEDITLMAWVYLLDYANYNGVIGKTNSNNPAPYDFYIIKTSGKPTLFMGNGASYDNFEATSAIGSGAWHHIAVTRSEANVVHYLDGATNGIDTGFAATTANQGDELYIGNRQDLGTDFKGKIDEVRIYNRSLTADEILAIYNSTKPYFIDNQTNTQTNSSGDYSYTFTAPSTAGSYEIKVNSTYNGVYGEANQTLTVTANSAPSITEINISPTSPSLSDSLDCNVTAIDDFNSSFTIEYWWYNNSVFHSGGNYTGYMNNTNTIIDTLGSGNTSSQEYWNCTVRAYDGSNYSAYYSSAYNFSNSAPSKVNLSYPAGNDSFFTNRTPKFNWTAAYDLEGDTLNYHIEVSLSEDMSSPLINETGVPNLYYEQSSELDFTTYFWRVRANDSQEFGDWSDIWNFTLRKSITITIVNDSIDFGLMELSETKNTTNNDPYPFVIRNDGNYWADLINISANQSLWSSVSLNTQYVRIKAANSSSEPNSFDASSSETEWINLTANNQSIVSQLNYSDSVDEAEIEMLITVPPAEAPGEKQVSVLFVWEEAPT